ncbi:MAG: 2-hydroxyacyl-CoA dehydratase family protein [Caldisericia bacterium]
MLWRGKPKSSCCENGDSKISHSVPALGHFDRMVSNCIDTAQMMKKHGEKLFLIFCEYTPRELIMAVGAVPVCACGGSHNMATASEKDLPSNLCPLIKSSYGFALEKANPIFEMSDLVIAETTCDGKKKMYEMLSKDKPMHILELTQKPDEESAFQHWFTEIKLLVKKLEELTGNKMTNERLLSAINLMNKERELRLKISEFGGTVLTGKEVLDAKASSLESHVITKHMKT